MRKKQAKKRPLLPDPVYNDQLVTRFEKLNPSLEPSHAFAEAIKIAPKLSKDTIIIVNSCGDAKKDRDILKAKLGKKYVK